MRQVTWEDRNGFSHVSLVRDGDPDEAAAQGIPLGPPDISSLDWQEVCRQVNNELARTGVLTWQDVVRSQNAVTRIVERVVRHKVLELFRQMDRDTKEAIAHE